MIKVVLFDLDETLFDHVNSRDAGITRVYEQYPHFTAYPVEQVRQDYFDEIEPLWPQIVDGTLTMEARLIEGFKRLGQRYQVDLQHDELGMCYREAYLAARRPMPGAMALLARLRPHVKIGIVTNHIREEQISKLAVCQFDPLIDFMVCSGDIGVQKPDRRIFDHALALAEATPSEAVMIGDSWSADVIGATSLGIRSVWLNSTGRANPDPQLALEINALEPTEDVARLLLGDASRI